MELSGKIAVVTGGASGIGEALALRFHQEGAAHVVVCDLDEAGAKAVAERIGGTGVGVDVANESAIQKLVAETLAAHGRIDLFASNAGFVTVGGLETPNEDFQRQYDVHVMSHIYAARAVLPSMIEQGGGYLLNTASAAGLLSQIGSAAYAVTKHAAVALAEWIAITHGYQNIRVSVLCPQFVHTNIIKNSPTRNSAGTVAGAASQDGEIQASDVAQTVIEALAEERFWVLPHPEVEEYVKRKAGDVDRWIGGMQRMQARLVGDNPQPGEALLKR